MHLSLLLSHFEHLKYFWILCWRFGFSFFSWFSLSWLDGSERFLFGGWSGTGLVESLGLLFPSLWRHGGWKDLRHCELLCSLELVEIALPLTLVACASALFLNLNRLPLLRELLSFRLDLTALALLGCRCSWAPSDSWHGRTSGGRSAQ